MGHWRGALQHLILQLLLEIFKGFVTAQGEYSRLASTFVDFVNGLGNAVVDARRPSKVIPIRVGMGLLKGDITVAR